MTDWKEFKLGDLYNVSSGLSKSKEYFGQGELFISFKDVFNNWFLPFEPKGRVMSNEKEQVTCSVKKGDILITRTSETSEDVGMSSVALKDYPKVTFNGFCKRLRPKKTSPIKVDPIYVAYLLRDRFFRKTVAQYATMTTRASLNGVSIKRINLKFPSFEEQEEIGKTLYNFDRKISLLQDQNKTIEKIAQTIFKEWFGKYQVGDELPKGWRVGKLEEVLEIKYGKDHKHLDDGTFPLYGSGGIMRYVEKPLYKKESILIPRKGTLSNLFYLEEPFWSVDTMFYSKIKNQVAGRYVYLFLKSINLASMNVGSAIPSLTTKVLNQIPIILPVEKILVDFDSAVVSLYKKKRENLKQIQVLENIRDVILPELISGNTRLKDFRNSL